MKEKKTFERKNRFIPYQRGRKGKILLEEKFERNLFCL